MRINNQNRIAIVILTSALMALVSSFAGASQDFLLNGQPITKLEATKTLISNPHANVTKACPVELTEKLTLKCKKQVASK